MSDKIIEIEIIESEVDCIDQETFDNSGRIDGQINIGMTISINDMVAFHCDCDDVVVPVEGWSGSDDIEIDRSELSFGDRLSARVERKIEKLTEINMGLEESRMFIKTFLIKCFEIGEGKYALNDFINLIGTDETNLEFMYILVAACNSLHISEGDDDEQISMNNFFRVIAYSDMVKAKRSFK